MTTRREFAKDESQNRKAISTALSTNVSSSTESTNSAATLLPDSALAISREERSALSGCHGRAHCRSVTYHRNWPYVLEC